jgi:hypothetical protein
MFTIKKDDILLTFGIVGAVATGLAGIGCTLGTPVAGVLCGAGVAAVTYLMIRQIEDAYNKIVYIFTQAKRFAGTDGTIFMDVIGRTIYVYAYDKDGRLIYKGSVLAPGGLVRAFVESGVDANIIVTE